MKTYEHTFTFRFTLQSNMTGSEMLGDPEWTIFATESAIRSALAKIDLRANKLPNSIKLINSEFIGQTEAEE